MINVGDKGENMADDKSSEEKPTHDTIYKESSNEDKGILAASAEEGAKGA